MAAKKLIFLSLDFEIWVLGLENFIVVQIQSKQHTQSKWDQTCYKPFKAYDAVPIQNTIVLILAY